MTGKTLIEVFGLDDESERARTKHALWMNVARSVALLSKCHRAKYGTVILDAGGRVVGTGYNGKPAGSCNDAVCYREGLPPDSKAMAKCCLHSEQNALAFADHAAVRGGTFYVTGLPCEDCALIICQSGIKTLVCMADERNYPGLKTMAQYGFTKSIDVVLLHEDEVIDAANERRHRVAVA